MTVPQNRANPAPIADRQTRAYELAAAGYTFRQIAAELGVSVATAHGDVHAALAEIPPMQRATFRAIGVDRLQQMWTKLWAQIEMGRDPVEVAPALLGVQRELAKITGANAPVEVITGTGAAPEPPVPVELADMIRHAEESAKRRLQEIRDRRRASA